MNKKIYKIYFPNTYQYQEYRNKELVFNLNLNESIDDLNEESFLKGLKVSVISFKDISEEKILKCIYSSELNKALSVIVEDKKLYVKLDEPTNAILFEKNNVYDDLFDNYLLCLSDYKKFEGPYDLNYNHENFNVKSITASKIYTEQRNQIKLQEEEISRLKKQIENKKSQKEELSRLRKQIENLTSQNEELSKSNDNLKKNESILEYIKNFPDQMFIQCDNVNYKDYFDKIEDYYTWYDYEKVLSNCIYYNKFFEEYKNVNDQFIECIFKQEKKLRESKSISIAIVGGGSGIELISLDDTLKKYEISANVTIVDKVIWPLNFFNRKYEKITERTIKLQRFSFFLSQNDFDIVIFSRVLNYTDMYLNNKEAKEKNYEKDQILNDLISCLKKLKNGIFYAFQVIPTNKHHTKDFDEELWKFENVKCIDSYCKKDGLKHTLIKFDNKISYKDD